MRVVMSRAGAGPPGVGLPDRGALHRDGALPTTAASPNPAPAQVPGPRRMVLVEAPRAQKDAAPDELRAPERRPATRAAEPRPAPSRPACQRDAGPRVPGRSVRPSPPWHSKAQWSPPWSKAAARGPERSPEWRARRRGPGAHDR